MPDTLLLDRTTWDLVIDAQGNIALATPPYALAQDAASAIKTFLGECYFDTTVGVPWLQQILGRNPTLALVAQQLVDAAETVPDVETAVVYVSSFSGRLVGGQVQVTSASTGQTSTAPFSVTNPQGAG